MTDSVSPGGRPGLHHTFWHLTGGQAAQNLGNHFLTIAISAYAFAMTGSVWAFALQQVAMFLPWTLFSGIAGPLVDRMDRRRILTASDLARAAICLLYPFCRTLEPLLVLNFANSVTRVFAMAARTALIPRLCPKERLLQTNGLRTGIFGAVDLLGPATAGFIMVRTGTTAGFYTAAVAMLAGNACFVAIPAWASLPRPTGLPLETKKRRLQGDLKEGASFILGNRGLRGTVLAYSVYSAGQNGVNAIFYPFVETVLHAGPQVFGLSISLYYGASLLAGTVLARSGQRISTKPLAGFVMPATALWLLYSVVRRLPVVLIMCFLEGALVSILANLFLTRIQAEAPAHMTGTVWGVAVTANSGCEVLGILATGALAGIMGPALAYRVLGSCGLAMALAAHAVGRRASKRAWPHRAGSVTRILRGVAR